ncbi:purine-cytosine permease family protein [Caldiplasma sukawensis]
MTEINSGSDETLFNEINAEGRKLLPSSQFYLWFGSNLTVADLFLGVYVQSLGLGFNYTLIAFLIANVLGGVLVGFMSYLGPKYGRGQMYLTRNAMGKKGGIAFSLLQLLNTGGWLTVNLIISATSLAYIISLTHGISEAVEITSIMLTMLFLILIVAYGHNSIKKFEKIMSVLLGILFLYLLVSSFYVKGQPYSSMGGTFSTPVFAAAIMLSFSYIMSWGPYAADYSRYIPDGRKNQMGSFIWTFAGSSVASFIVEVIGFLIGYRLNLGGNFENSVFLSLLGPLWFVGSMALFLGGAAANSLNLYSNLMSIRSMGIRFSKYGIMSAVSVIVLILSYIFFYNFDTYFEGFLYVLDYWITPWLGVMICEFFILKNKDYSGINVNWPPLIAYIISILISIPFMDTVESSFGITIPFYNLTGGADISYGISFVVSIILTIVFETTFRSRFNRENKLMELTKKVKN